MRRICNIFESRSYRGTGQPVFTPASITALILSVVSFLAAVFIIANYDEIAARIAIWVAGFLSTACGGVDPRCCVPHSKAEMEADQKLVVRKEVSPWSMRPQ